MQKLEKRARYRLTWTSLYMSRGTSAYSHLSEIVEEVVCSSSSFRQTDKHFKRPDIKNIFEKLSQFILRLRPIRLLLNNTL